MGGMVGLLSACAQQPKTLYTWDSYQPSVYAYLTEDSTDALSAKESMEENVEAARADGEVLPPGFRAHLGMLYLKSGQPDKAFEQFEGEKTAYPESVGFMDFLIRNQAPKASPTEQPSARIESQTMPATPHTQGG